MVRRALLTSMLMLCCAAPAQAEPTWLPPGTFAGARFPSVAVDDDGVASIATYSVSGTDRVVGASVHTLGSDLFEPPVAASPAAKNNSPQTDVNARGDVVVGWDDGTRAWAAIKPAGGDFGEPIDLGPATTGLGYNVQIQIADDGDVAASWWDSDGANFVMHWIVKPAGGPLGPLGTDVTTTSGFAPPRLAMNGAGDAVVTWNDYDGTHWYVRAASRPADGSFGLPVTLSDTSQDARLPYPAVTEDGGAAVVWTRSNGTNDIIQISRRSSAGGDFGIPLDMSQTGTDATLPVLAANAGGELLAVWIRGINVQARLGSLTGSFDPITDFGRNGTVPQAALSDSGAAIVTWGDSNRIRASLRAPGGGFRAPFDVVPDAVSYYANVPGAPVGMTADGDVVVAWFTSGFAGTGYRVYDVAGPKLRDLNVPGSATATEPVTVSVSPLDAFSAVASTHWDFGDGSSADGASVAHAFSAPGTYAVKVTSTDAVGNATTATRTIAVAAKAAAPAPPSGGGTVSPPPPPPGPKPCKVPSLKHVTKTKAKAKLKAAGCALGKTIIPKKLRKAKGLVVVKQSRRARTTAKAGAKVDVTLGRKPKPKPKPKRR